MKTIGMAFAALAFACASTIAAAQTAEDFVGTWKNVKDASTTADGKTTSVFGPTGIEQRRDIARFGPNEFTWTLTNSLGGKGETTWQRIKSRRK